MYRSSSYAGEGHKTLLQQFSYDPWGKQYSVSSNSLFTTYSNPGTSKGYTGHNMINDFEVIHMNGRTYNPHLGRFMQANPFIQAPTNLHNYNRYSYVLNNPMSYTDPSGYYFGTGNFRAAMRAGATQYASNFAIKSIGSHYQDQSGSGNIYFGGNYLTAGQVAGQIAAHAIVGGVTASLQGGKFGHGFFSAGVTKGAGGAWLPAGGDLGAGDVAYGTVVSAVIGGTASVISGGKFANGAQTAAFQYLFNQVSKNSINRGRGRPELTENQKMFMQKHAGFYHFWKNNGDISIEATACAGPCLSFEGEYTDKYGLSGSGSLASEWGYGVVYGVGADFTIFNSRDVYISDGTWTPTRAFSAQFGFLGISTTRYESFNGHLTTNIELKVRFPGGFSANGGGGIKKW